jgi:hypothetical protein
MGVAWERTGMVTAKIHEKTKLVHVRCEQVVGEVRYAFLLALPPIIAAQSLQVSDGEPFCPLYASLAHVTRDMLGLMARRAARKARR